MEKLIYWTYCWWKKSSTSWQVVYPKGSQGFIHPRCCKISSNSIAVFGYPRWIYGACCENLRGNRITTVASETPGLHPSHEERGTKRKQNWKGGISGNGRVVSQKNARASQTNSVINCSFFTFYKRKQVFLVEFLCEFFFWGGLRDIPPPKKTSPPNMTLPGLTDPHAGALKGIWGESLGSDRIEILRPEIRELL